MPVNVEEKLWWMATGNSYRSCGLQFEIRGCTRLRAPIAEAIFLYISSACLHQVSRASMVMQPKVKESAVLNSKAINLSLSP